MYVYFTLVIIYEVHVLTHSLKTLPFALLYIGLGRRDQLGVVELRYLNIRDNNICKNGSIFYRFSKESDITRGNNLSNCFTM